MPRNVSLAAIQGALAQQTDEIYLVLLEIDHPSLGSPLRFVNDSQDITSNMNLYTAFPFEVKLPDDQEGREPRAELRIDNVTRELIDEIRTIQDPFNVTLSVILASSPSIIEWGPMDMLSSGVVYDANNITFQLIYSVFAEEPFPYMVFDTIDFPGMFK